MRKILSSIFILIIVSLAFYFLSLVLKGKAIEPIQQMASSQEAAQSESQTEPANDKTKRELKIEILEEGQGQEAESGQKLSVHYTGWLEDGTRFDSSLDRGEPFGFTLGRGQVIKGWDEGLLGMKLNEKRKLTIPSELGYGELGTPNSSIPPNSTLIFEIELLEIKKD